MSIMIVLPRQAPDKHRESTPKKKGPCCFPAACSMPRQEHPPSRAHLKAALSCSPPTARAVRKHAACVLAAVYVLKMPSSFYQDRLGTNIRKVDLRERERRFFLPLATVDVDPRRNGAWVRQTPLFAPFYVKYHYFTKTDSGQT